MPLPAQGPCEISDDVCCTAIFDYATFILNTVYEAMLTCLPLDCAGKPLALRRYVTMGFGDDGIADSLTVAFSRGVTSYGSRDLPGKDLQVVNHRGTFDVRLRESGWPMSTTDGGRLDAPDPDTQQAVARHAYSHGEKMYRTLRGMASHRFQWLANYVRPSYFTVGDLIPLNPQGGIVGWSVGVTMDLPWNVAGQ